MKNLMQWKNPPAESNEWLEKSCVLNPLNIRHGDYSEQTIGKFYLDKIQALAAA
ncbi:hypothetical protein [Pseudomonas lini]|uniref:hypothetical protein n=1 Tax=Pseudomonas lini TaxID=163011 RepID=UPI0016519F9D|nr:hypothetical protein [Pseudomonas lini]